MFCPECGYEYRKGLTQCPDCRVALQEEPPAEQETTYAEYIEVLDTFNPFDIAIIKSLLEAEGIRHYFIGENFGGIYPMVTAPKLMVIKEHKETATEILKDLDLTYLASHSMDDEWMEDSEPDNNDEVHEDNDPEK